MARATKKTVKKSTKKTTAKKTTAKKTTAKKASRAVATKSTKKSTKKKPASNKATAKKAVSKAVELEAEVATEEATDDTPVVAIQRRGSERRKVQRRRQIDPTTCERDYSDEEIAFMRAMDEYKRNNGRMFPTCSEILEVVRALGYVRQSTASQPQAGETGVPADGSIAAPQNPAGTEQAECHDPPASSAAIVPSDSGDASGFPWPESIG